MLHFCGTFCNTIQYQFASKIKDCGIDNATGAGIKAWADWSKKLVKCSSGSVTHIKENPSPQEGE